ncbi:hypothetical protein AAY473_023292 [Plecturocebus cupreus]
MPARELRAGGGQSQTCYTVPACGGGLCAACCSLGVIENVSPMCYVAHPDVKHQCGKYWKEQKKKGGTRELDENGYRLLERNDFFLHFMNQFYF